jgi:hypothetical protein
MEHGSTGISLETRVELATETREQEGEKKKLEEQPTFFIDQEGVYLPYRSIKPVIVSFGRRNQ